MPFEACYYVEFSPLLEVFVHRELEGREQERGHLILLKDNLLKFIGKNMKTRDGLQRCKVDAELCHLGSQLTIKAEIGSDSAWHWFLSDDNEKKLHSAVKEANWVILSALGVPVHPCSCSPAISGA